MSNRIIVIDGNNIPRESQKTRLPVAERKRVSHKEPKRPGSEKVVEVQGRMAWTLLHEYTGCDPYVVRLWEGYIPSGGGCSCKENYRDILKEHPFDFSSPDAFFRSGIELHNAVNRKLSKPELTLDEAYRIWRPVKE
jgi:hypothetical protein